MVKELIIEFDKNNEEKRIMKYYIQWGIPTLIILQIIFPIYISIILFSIIICFLLYIYIYRIKHKKISKEIINVKKNIIEYTKYNITANRTWAISFLKNNNLYNKESILFIIDNLRSKKKTKIQRDWISIMLSISIAFVTASIKESSIDFNILLYLIIQIVPYIIMVFILFVTLKSLIWMFKTTFQVEASIETLEEILTDIYLELN